MEQVNITMLIIKRFEKKLKPINPPSPTNVTLIDSKHKPVLNVWKERKKKFGKQWKKKYEKDEKELLRRIEEENYQKRLYILRKKYINKGIIPVSISDRKLKKYMHQELSEVITSKEYVKNKLRIKKNVPLIRTKILFLVKNKILSLGHDIYATIILFLYESDFTVSMNCDIPITIYSPIPQQITCECWCAISETQYIGIPLCTGCKCTNGEIHCQIANQERMINYYSDEEIDDYYMPCQGPYNESLSRCFGPCCN